MSKMLRVSSWLGHFRHTICAIIIMHRTLGIKYRLLCDCGLDVLLLSFFWHVKGWRLNERVHISNCVCSIA